MDSPHRQLAPTLEAGILSDTMRPERSAASRLAPLRHCSTLELTTVGRVSGKRHTVTVWFLVDGDRLYLVTLKMGRDWPRNLLKNSSVELKIGRTRMRGQARQITNPKRFEHVKRLLAQKYWAAWLGSWFGVGPEGAFAVTIEP